MTQVGKGGVALAKLDYRRTFERDFKKLTAELQELVRKKLDDLLAEPRPPGLRFEKLKGYKRPDIYTIHITGNYKMSFEIEGDIAILRRVANHDKIDGSP